jgi:hypothetical protein
MDGSGGIELATSHTRLQDKTLAIPKLTVGLYKLQFSPEGQSIPENVPPFIVTLALCKFPLFMNCFHDIFAKL